MSDNSNVYNIPGVTEAVPVDMVTELKDGSVVNADINDPKQPNWYRFGVEGNKHVTITFQGPASEYAIENYKIPFEKGGTGNAHEEKTDDVITHLYSEPGPYTIFLSVASANGNNWPTRGYTISMSVAA